jgi:DNA-binding response OmpR family regulator
MIQERAARGENACIGPAIWLDSRGAMASMARPVVLAVDDDEDVIESFRLILEDDYEVAAALDGAAAVAVLENRPVGVVLLDLRLPDMDGLDLFQKMRALDPRLPVIVVTAVDRSRKAVEALRLGALDYVVKPFEEERLLELIRQALRQRAFAPGAAAVASRTTPGRLLFISKEIGARAAVKVALTRRYAVVSVAELPQALRELCQARFDVVVAQVGSGMVAYEVEAIRHHYRAGPLILIVQPAITSLRPASWDIVLSEPLDFTRLFAEISAVNARVDEPWTGFSERVARAVGHVARDYQSLTAEELARRVGVARGHLVRTFEAEIGFNLKRFILLVRIEVAKALLTETRAKMRDIARHAGFHDGGHMRRVFRHYGTGNPRKYR